MHYYWLALGVLCVWRVTHLLAEEDGPWRLMARLRLRAGNGFWAGLLECFYCLSLWIAAPFAIWLGQSWKERALLWPAMSALAILLERLTAREQTAPPAAYWEEEEQDRGMLRRKE